MPTLNKAYSLLHREEKRREAVLPSIDYANGIDVNFEQVAVNSAGQTFSLTGPRDNQSKSHFKECPRFTYCNMMGHVQNRLFPLHGYPQSSPALKVIQPLYP